MNPSRRLLPLLNRSCPQQAMRNHRSLAHLPRIFESPPFLLSNLMRMRSNKIRFDHIYNLYIIYEIPLARV